MIIPLISPVLNQCWCHVSCQVCTAYGLWWFPWLWLIASEILCALTFRDNLVLGVIQTIAPQVSQASCSTCRRCEFKIKPFLVKLLGLG